MAFHQIPENWGVYVRTPPRAPRIERRRDWLEELLATRYGIIPAPEATYGVSTLMRYLLPDLFTDEYNTWRHRNDRPYDVLKELGLFYFEHCHRFEVLINVNGRKTKNKKRTRIEVLIDKNGRGPWMAKYGEPAHARQALLNRLPQGSEATLIS